LVEVNLEAILNGQSPTTVFAHYLERHPNASKGQLYIAFTNAFPGVDGVSFNVIANWRRPGMDDTKFDLIIRDLLQEAGYIT
jgi:hypothetical protein